MKADETSEIEMNSIDKRATLLRHVENAPGIRYRELLRVTGLSNGVLFYHLTSLEEEGQICVQRKHAKVTRYYPINISESESSILPFIRHEPFRQIMQLLLEYDVLTVDDIVKYTNKAPSTISGHLKRLKGEGLISVTRNGLHLFYSLNDVQAVAEVMSKYRTSHINNAVKNFIGMVEEL